MVEIILTLPPPFMRRMKDVAEIQGADMFRYNTGVVTPYGPFETLRRILEVVPKDKLWIDIKGPQLRIEFWVAPFSSEITLNRDFDVELPAMIYFRHDNVATIVAKNGRKIYVEPLPRYTVGAGQAVNIHGNDFKVKGTYLTDICRKYIEAARDLGIHRYMLSFFEKQSDIAEVLAIDPGAEICVKIETPAGLEIIKNGSWSGDRIRIMAARDDFFINLGFDAKKMFEAQELIIEKDSRAIAASRMFSSLERGEDIEFSDLSDIYLLKKMGYESFLLSDSLSVRPDLLRKAVTILRSI